MNWFSRAKRVKFFDIAHKHRMILSEEPFASNDSSTMLLFHVMFKDTITTSSIYLLSLILGILGKEFGKW